jgi:hypothetical protein
MTLSLIFMNFNYYFFFKEIVVCSYRGTLGINLVQLPQNYFNLIFQLELLRGQQTWLVDFILNKTDVSG